MSAHLRAGEQEGGAENLHGVRGVCPAAAQRQQPVPPPIAAQGEGCRAEIHIDFAQLNIICLYSSLLYTYEESPRGAASGLTRCNFFRLQTSLLSFFLVQMG